MRIFPNRSIGLTSVTCWVFSHHRNRHRLFAKNNLLNQDFLEEFQLLLEVCWCSPPFCIQNAKIDQTEKSKNCFEKVINLDKKNIESYCGIAEIFEKKGNLKEAEIFYKKAIKIDDLHHIANHRYGKLLFRLNQHLKGLKLIEKVSGMIRFKNETIEIK